MPSIRAALLPLAVVAYAVSCVTGVTACDTKATAVDDCRELETARCAAARSCDFGIDSDEKEAECKRFARDNCLHGLSTGKVPKRGTVDSCLRVIRGAGECASDQGGDAPASDCESIGQTQSVVSVCEVVEDPTQAYECAFLLEDPPEPPDPEPEDAGADGS
jgi:hypothetical protein